MTWDEPARRHLLASDETFLARYCAPAVLRRGEERSGTLDRIKHAPGKLPGDLISSARRIILCITLLVPHGAHATPTYGPGAQPVISVGRLKASGWLSGPHFGLCQVDGRFHIWCPRRVIARWPALLRERVRGGTSGWVPWRPGQDHPAGNALLMYDQPLDSTPARPVPAPLLPGGDVHTLLLAIEHLLQQNQGEPDVAGTLTEQLFSLRQLLGEPGGLTAIYPALIASGYRGSGARHKATFLTHCGNSGGLPKPGFR